MLKWILAAVLLFTSPTYGAEWIGSGTAIVVPVNSLLLTRGEAEQIAVDKKKLELEVELLKKRVQFFEELSEDAKKVIGYYKEKSEDFKTKLVASENKKSRRTLWNSFLGELGKALLLNKVIEEVKF